MPALTAQLVRYISLTNTQRSDGELLAGFLNHSDEADFAELIRRHGPMVWGTCRRNLPDFADAEDAFQTVFLVLVQRGKRLFSSHSIGPWLHRVAVWTTRNVRRRNARQLARREILTEQIPAKTGNVDLSLDIDAALLSLPEKVRSSIVLCHILGYSRADAAAQLGCAERTLSSWISRGLAQLRERLPGLDPAKALSVGAAVIPLGLADTVVKAAIASRTAAVAASALSPNVSQLVEGVIRMFWVKKATATTVALFTMFAFGVGIGVTTHQLSPAAGGEADAAAAGQDIDDLTIAALEKRIDESTTTLSRTEAKIRLFEEKSASKENSDVQNKQYREAIALLQKDANSVTTKLAELRAALKSAQERKAAKALEKTRAQPQKTQGQPPQDADKQLDELKKRLMKLQAEADVTQAEHLLRLEAQKVAIHELNALIAKLQKEKAQREKDKPAKDLDAVARDLSALQSLEAAVQDTASRPKGGYLELNLGTTMGSSTRSEPKGEKIPSLPYHVNEIGPDGKLIGSVYFTNADVLGRYLARTLKDSKGPKELRIVTRADAPAEQLKLVVEVCKAAGFQDIVISKTGVAEKGVAEKLNDATTDTKLKMEYAQELLRAHELQRRQKLEQEKGLLYLQKLLEEKETEIHKLKESNKLHDQKQKEKLLQETQDALEQKQAELQNLLDQKEAEIRKLKESNKLDDQKQKEKILQETQKALEQKQSELQKLLDQKEAEIRKLKELNKLGDQKQKEKAMQDYLKAIEQSQAEFQKLFELREAELRKQKESNKLPKKDEPAGPKKP